ncbi:MAG: metallophosphoesterase family protein, partial [Bacteroidales bacterium]
MKYAISDIHGMFDKFLLLLEKINFSDNDELYIIGDVIDRGDKPIETLEYIMNKPNMHLLMGNHEYWMLCCYDAYLQRKIYPYELIEAKQVWMQNGGNVTLKQFQKLPREKQISIIKFLRKCPYYLIIDKFILCHAGIRMDEKFENKSVEEILKHQSADDLLNIRSEFYNNKA